MSCDGYDDDMGPMGLRAFLGGISCLEHHMTTWNPMGMGHVHVMMMDVHVMMIVVHVMMIDVHVMMTTMDNDDGDGQ